jgi:SWI/SNF related-matrix-associated actin-dependent regulator of chromatin subfamily C
VRPSPSRNPLNSTAGPNACLRLGNPNSPDSRLKWRKRKRNPDASPSKPSTSAAADHSSDSDSADEDAAAVHGAAGAGDDDEAPAASEDPAALGLREAEVLPSAEPISAFPAAKRRVVNRPHPSVLALLEAERSACSGDVPTVAPPALENISHGQLQVLSGVLPDHPSLVTDPDKPSLYVCTPPPLMEGHGVPKQFQGRLHVVPKHSGSLFA